ncbi:class I SAM-dependent methyltransferase [Arthrobacter zhaoxinii]|uniref:Class I SAM-dependent methyltransferase n=1 Tax=Arthrobacter zhaoxinii TaxID=2964616 RepID=A0ABY5YLD4_9MICC|nr:class I SAM-dependent methyltransferase [Arthrobacter zhaoxinii]UWX95907.1 class I SAM-dependent methyltransferase [Arthrobacter zhaoxinii]
MIPSADLDSYAEKMRRLVEKGMDFEVDARFVDMLAPRNSRILDIGCGIGSAVSALRRSGHQVYGIDPTRAVLDVAADIFDKGWYRQLAVEELADDRLCGEGLPGEYEVILMSGNVPAFLSDEALQDAFRRVRGLLVDGGLFVVGTTVGARGGPTAQDAAAGSAGLPLKNRFSDWHLGAFDKDSGWSVSVYAKPGALSTRTGPDGVFLLKR